MPLRFILAAIGSAGDVNPVIELGRGLRARGHSVLLATNEIFEGQVRENGLDFVELGPRSEAERIMRDPRLWHPVRGFGCIVERAILPNLERLYRIIEERRGPGIVVAATTLCLGARVAQERLGVPTATLHMQPSVIRSHVDGGRLGPVDLGPGMPRPLKRALYAALDVFFVERRIGPGLDALRAAVGLRTARGALASYLHSPELVLGLFPEWFAPAQEDWPPQLRQTGFLLHDSGHRPGDLEPALAFLAEGPPPVLVTPGSAAVDRVRFFRSSVLACERARVRAMLVTNHPGQLPSRLPPGVRGFPYLPFGRVMPGCAAVIHHGGIGTLAQCVRAGVPQLIVPNAHDQPDNGQRIERLGLGLRVGSPWFGPSKAAGCLRTLLGSAQIRERCRHFAAGADPEAALARACGLLEGLGAGAAA
jgi:rhamnosyltransferase subunit B